MMENGKRNSHETRAEDRMDQNELEEPHDDFAVEITNLHHDNEEGSSRTPRFFMEPWLLSPKYRKQKTIATAIGMGLALLIVLFALGDRCLSTESGWPCFPEEPIRSSVYLQVSIC